MRYYSLILLVSCNHYEDGEFMDYISPKGGYFVDAEEVYELAKYRKMERVIFSKKAVKKFILNNFIVVNLAVDDKRRLPEHLIKKSKYKDKQIKTVGYWNSEFQADLTDNNSQPYFAVVNSKGELIADRGYTSRKGDFVYFLKSAIEKYNIQQNQN